MRQTYLSVRYLLPQALRMRVRRCLTIKIRCGAVLALITCVYRKGVYATGVNLRGFIYYSYLFALYVAYVYVYTYR